MIGFEITLLIVVALSCVIYIIRRNTRDPFEECGRRVYAENEQ